MYVTIFIITTRHLIDALGFSYLNEMTKYDM